jgi:enoyl-CoA hydratase/carnithine racemase
MARMPFSAVLRMVVLGKAGRITATQALRQHLVSEVVPTADLMTRARELGMLISEYRRPRSRNRCALSGSRSICLCRWPICGLSSN